MTDILGIIGGGIDKALDLAGQINKFKQQNMQFKLDNQMAEWANQMNVLSMQRDIAAAQGLANQQAAPVSAGSGFGLSASTKNMLLLGAVALGAFIVVKKVL